MTRNPVKTLAIAAALSAAAMLPTKGSAQPDAGGAIKTFVPYDQRIQHRIDYSIWTEALSHFVVSMGPPLRKTPFQKETVLGTFRRVGHNSIYRLEGSMMGFTFMNREVIDSFTEYRRDLESVADTLDIQSLPRNEQLSYWLNLHNVAMVEQIAKNWPVRQPREIEIDGVPLNDAKFITVEGVRLSPRDIRTRIVYPNWKDPKVIYGFWHGEIGGPALHREAFEAARVASLLEISAREFTSSRRGIENRGDTLHVSEIYEEAAPFYFRDFESDLRRHLLTYAGDDASEKIRKTTVMKANLREHDIADLSGGARTNPIFSTGRAPRSVADLLRERERKFQYMRRKEIPTGYVIFGEVDLPENAQGQSRNRNEVE